ncbi:hypothetical protein WPS_22770 [Vulcanimicrobium alpinum]|uniref:Uncharacterized protein n=1 Tax=Vulcanimicrobium alpinum TaxID=3016050 RepID=A0AAN2CAE1_UNVUL|nr:glycosyltransferase 87 family protein [Vulcanimicrobium alpinum]BDE07001.1 hypothetical protein WPS_22770 [Vulcanimicrobium alpinum]
MPPFALLAYATLSALPFSSAMIVYGALLAAAMTLAVFLLARVTRAPLFVVAVALAPIAWSDAILRGQPFAIVLLAFAASAYLLQRSRPAAAACCLLAATVQPHVALPALLGALVLVPRMRISLLLGGIALAGASVVLVGPAVTTVYLRDVLPAHASANAYEWQFSLTSLLTSIGIAARPAITAGSLTFAVMTLLGIVAAERFVRRDGDAAAAVLIPPAFAVFLGVHVHYHQLALAFPAMLFVLVRYERWRSIAGGGLVAAMLPWDTIIAPFLIGVWTMLAAIVGRFVYGPRPALWLAAGTALFAVGISLAAFLHPALGGGASYFTPHPYPPDGLAETSWSNYSRQVLSRTSPLFMIMRMPTVLGLLAGIVAIGGAAFAPSAAADAMGRVTAFAQPWRRRRGQL